MYYVLERSLAVWSVQVADWRWRLDDPLPAPAPAPALDAWIDRASLVDATLDVLDALGALDELLSPEATAEQPAATTAEHPHADAEPIAAPPSPPRRTPASPPAPVPPALPVVSPQGRWVLVGMKTLWGTTVLDDPIAALERQTFMLEEAADACRRTERDRRLSVNSPAGSPVGWR